MPSFVEDKNTTKLCCAEIEKVCTDHTVERSWLLSTWYAVLIGLHESARDFHRSIFSKFIEFVLFLIEGKNKTVW
jgi:hypothetical protein